MQIDTIESFVNIMDLQALMHISKAKKKAKKYMNVGDELTNIIGRIFYNKNLMLDKNIIRVNENNPTLNIFLASDYGMCGRINTDIKNSIIENKESYKIIVGKKIRYIDEKVLFKIDKDRFIEDFNKIEKELVEAIEKNKYSKINIFYNDFDNVSDIKFKKMQLFPVEFDSKSNSNEDFVVETDVELLLKHLISYYLCYEVKLCEIMSWASENIIRSQLTKTSLSKLERIKEKRDLIESKKKRSKIVSKSIDNFKSSINLDLQ